MYFDIHSCSVDYIPDWALAKMNFERCPYCPTKYFYITSNGLSKVRSPSFVSHVIFTYIFKPNAAKSAISTFLQHLNGYHGDGETSRTRLKHGGLLAKCAETPSSSSGSVSTSAHVTKNDKVLLFVKVVINFLFIDFQIFIILFILLWTVARVG